MAAAYSQIGPYKSGLWLVEKGGSSALVWGRTHLPAEGQGFRYYWLGSNYHQARERFGDGVGAFNFDVGNVQWSDQRWAEAIRKGVSSNVTNPGGFSVADALLYGAAGIAGTIVAAPVLTAGAVESATAGEGAAAGAGGGAAAGDAAAGGGGGAAAGGAAGKAASSTLTKDLAGAGAIAAVAAIVTGYGLRLGEIVAGGLLVLFGLYVLANGTTPKLSSVRP